MEVVEEEAATKREYGSGATVMTVDVSDQFWYRLKGRTSKAEKIMEQYKSTIETHQSSSTTEMEEHMTEIRRTEQELQIKV